MPGKIVYVDCKFRGQGEVEISWGWPVVSIETAPSESGASAEPRQTISSESSVRVVDKSVTHAVIQYMEGGQHKEVTAKKSPFIYKG